MKNKASILIVDDDVEMTETLADVLEDSGYDIEVANDGFKAIEKVKARTFDVVLMDIKMPGINGVETFKEIKTIQPEAAVMMMTGYAVEDLVAEALEEGAYGVMYKPINVTKAVDFIERIRKGGLILVVDDDLSTCETIIKMLKKEGYRVSRASSGEEAIKKVQKRSFDVVLIDVMIPVMNGLEVYLALKKIRPDIKAIIMTSYRQEVQDLVEGIIRKGAYTCIYKPLDIMKLLKVIEEILAIKKTETSKVEVN